jgi:hypothetical protein
MKSRPGAAPPDSMHNRCTFAVLQGMSGYSAATPVLPFAALIGIDSQVLAGR